MSTGAQVAILDPRGLRQDRSRSEPAAGRRPMIRHLAFGALGFYGALRWGTMLTPSPVGRMLGLLAVAVLLAVIGPWLRGRSTMLTILAAGVAAVVMLVVAGVPFSWLRHVRLAVTADSIGEGLSSLPRAFVPYDGINDSVRMVILLGGGALLLLAALPLAFATGDPGGLPRAAAALPLVALAAVPSTLARPQLAYLHGLILFALLAGFAWGDGLRSRDTTLAVTIITLAGLAAMIVAPRLDGHNPWVNYEAIAGTLSPGRVEAFDWSQRYGPLKWPRDGREVLDVAAARPDYWKTENLELLRGPGWQLGSTDYGAEIPAPVPDSIGRWSQSIQVTLRGMRSQSVIGAGFSAAPVHLTQAVSPGVAAGTWRAAGELQPGDSYRITTYSPRPTAAELERAGTRYSSAALQGELTIVMTQPGLPDQQIVFGPLGSQEPPVDVANYTGASGAAVLRASPYAGVYALSQRLARHARTPAAYVSEVLNYLGRGYSYDENPPPSRYPLVSFLLKAKVGYCQQFAGAMALLLRMGGVPARVATGFTTGTYDHSRHEYVISDLNAHAWVEAWFPRYGWVRFDPTPRSAPARSGHVPLPAFRASVAPATPIAPARRPDPSAARAPTAPVVHHGGSAVPVILGGLILLGLFVLGLIATAQVREPDAEALLAELERAMTRARRPLSGGVTLAALEHRFRSAPEAAGYISALRMMRFGGVLRAPTSAQRRALRAQLRSGLGITGRLRALWALPPRWRPKLRGMANRGRAETTYTPTDG